MNYWLVAAAVVSGITCGIHVFVGGPELLSPLLLSNLNPAAKSVWIVVWHTVTALIALNSVAFIVSAQPGARALLISSYPLAISFCMIVLFLFFSITQHGSIIALPQWTLFLASSVLAIVGLMSV